MDEKKKLLITIAITAVVCLALVGVLAWQFRILGEWPMENPESLNAEIANLERQKTQLEQKVFVELPAKREELASLEGLDTLARQLLPDRIRPEVIQDAVRAKAQQALIDITSSRLVTPRRGGSGGFGPADSSAYEERVLELELVGAYDELGLFINYLETFEMRGPDDRPVRRFFAVKDIEIEALEDGLTEGSPHEIELSVSTYRYKAPAGPQF